MSELGSGSGSSYPSALDTNTTLEVNSPSGSKTKARAEVPNDLGAAVVAVQTELGTDPAGTLTDVKTYLQTEHETDGSHAAITATSVTTDTISEETATSGITIDGCLIKDAGVTAMIDQGGGSVLKVSVIDIGDWDMDTVATVAINHGLTLSNIINVSAIVRNDADLVRHTLTPALVATPSEIEGFINSVNSAQVFLSRKTGGVYDVSTFSTTSYNRGWITIWHI